MNISIKKDKTIIVSYASHLFHAASLKAANEILLFGTNNPFHLERELSKNFSNLHIKTYDSSPKSILKIKKNIDHNKTTSLYIHAGEYIYEFLNDINIASLIRYNGANIVFPNFRENYHELCDIIKKLFFYTIVAYVVRDKDLELTFCKDNSVRFLPNTIINLDQDIEKFF